MRRTTTIATLAATCTALALAAPMASGKTVKLQGPVDQTYFPSPAGFATKEPAIEMKVTFTGKKPRLIPAGTLKAEGIYGLCQPGSYGCNNYCDPVTGVCEAPQCFPSGTMFGNDIKIKKKKFSGSFSDLEGFDAPQDVRDGNFFRVTGKVGKKSATGTVHARQYVPADSEHPASTCDTGVLKWSASK